MNEAGRTPGGDAPGAGRRPRCTARQIAIVGQTDGNTSMANLISSDTSTVLSLSSGCMTKEAQLIVNARVAIDPETLQRAVESVVDSIGELRQASATIHSVRSFRPGRPVPDHRIHRVAQDPDDGSGGDDPPGLEGRLQDLGARPPRQQVGVHAPAAERGRRGG